MNRTKISADEEWTVLGKQTDAVALGKATRSQPAAPALHGRAEFVVADQPPAHDQRGGVGLAAGQNRLRRVDAATNLQPLSPGEAPRLFGPNSFR